MTRHNEREPIAIIGIGCRFPGQASNPQRFWDLLCQKTDAIIDVPEDRWDIRRFYDPNINVPGKMIVKRGGFLKEKWHEFDAEFFHISPREAKFLDPQQRLLLEVSWEAMEDAGLVPHFLRGADGGIFIGAFTTDWQTLQNSPYNRHHCEMYSGINGSKTILSARLSHFFDLKGPCLSVDTACSSSLVAIHLACQSLWQNECSFALAGGVNAILVPETSIAMSKARVLNPDGQCRSFDADARGYVRGEGAGIVILKRLSQAVKDQDPIYALVLGTGVNQDGYTSGGITQPNPEAQKTLIEKVLSESKVAPADIIYVEGHGTGTLAGDPAETQAIDRVLNINRTHSYYLGSVKSNIGHLEAAAGIAGLIKTALCLKHKKIPPNLHFKTPNPNIPFEKYRIKIPTEITDFPSTDRAFAFVNSFGYGGTNANAVLQSYEEPSKAPSPFESLFAILPFSAKNNDDFSAIAASFENFLKENPKASLTDIAYTLAYRKSSFDYRLSIGVESKADLEKKLRYLKKGEIPEGCIKGKPLSQKSPLTFIYTGMGPQWWGMARDLLENSPDFLKIIQQCSSVLQPIAGWSLLDELKKSEADSRMDHPEVSQAANFSIQAALTEVLKQWDVKPDYIIGHSIGEVAAAYTAGALTLEEGVQLSFHRSRLQSKRKDLGTMLATGLSLNEAQSLLEKYQGKVSIAAENSQNAITLSGNKAALDEIAESLEKAEVFHRFLKVNIAYHSHQMDGLEEEVADALRFLTPKKPVLPFYSTVYGEEYNGFLNQEYWWRNIRQPVLFSSALKNVIEKGCQLFLEIGPHPVLASYIQESLGNGKVLAALNRKKVDRISLQECLGGLFVSGYPLKFSDGNFIKLPTYSWRRQHHWVESEKSRHYRLSAQQYAMLSRKLETALPTWQVEVNRHHFPWMEDHKIDGTIVFPAAAYVEAALEIQAASQETTACCLEEVVFHQLLTVQAEKEPILQILLDQETGIFKIHSLPESTEKEWTCHASGRCKPWEGAVQKSFERFQDSKLVEGEAIYQLFAEKGLEYGPNFQGIRKLWKKGKEALAEIHPCKDIGQYCLHPSLLDAAFQTLIGTIEQNISDQGIILPQQIDQMILYRSLNRNCFCHAVCTKQTDHQIEGNLEISDEFGNVCVQIKGLKCRIIPQNSSRVSHYIPQWIEKPLEKNTVRSGFWLFDSEKLKQCFELPCAMLDQINSSDENLNIVLGPTSPIPLYELAQSEIQITQRCVDLVKAINERRAEKTTNLWIVTKNLSGASLWGLGRVIRQECPNIRLFLIEVEEDVDFSLLVQELLYSHDQEISLGNSSRRAYQLKKADSDTSSKSTPLQAFSLELKTPGKLESLFYKEVEVLDPLPHEIGMQVHASSLNFKDLMKILGMLNQNALAGTYFGTSFGMECAGTIVSVGKKVKKYKVGDQICAFMPNSFQSYMTVSKKFISPIPYGCTLDNAAIYVPFLTVLWALKDIGKLKKGESILIHSATGAVGLAAIQYARHMGARIFATAGSQEKRAYLKELGVERCADSRSLSFVEEIRQWTDGQGVDVVLNSLGGEALTKSFSLLASHGRFLEIGKKDISLNSKLPMKDFDRNTLFASIDMDRIFADQPDIIKKLLKETYALFKKGVFQPLPCKGFSANDCVEAFQFMARSKQIGKIMLKFAGQTVSGVPLNTQQLIDANSSYLITGGLSGFGLLSAKWLAEKGARHLILLSRSGASTKEAKEAVQLLEDKGVQVKVAAVDIANFEELSTVIKSMPSIKGVIHSAMVLSDAFLMHQTEESVRKVLSPKIAGCLNLHRLTAGLKLDFFVLFSSIASIIGNPGQGNYAAANSFLDKFCHYRNSLGLPATTINWGALKMGALSRDTKVAEHLAKNGIFGISPSTALKALEKSLIAKNSQMCVLDLDWNRLMKALPELNTSFAFADFRSENDQGSVSTLVEKLQALDQNQRQLLITDKIVEIVSKTLKMDVSKIDITVKLSVLGIDSLMTMELLATIESEMGIKVPTMELMKGPTIEQLSRVILRLLKLN